MSTPNPTEPIKLGTLVKIRNSGFGRARVAEYRGPLGPNGARVYRVQYRKKPHAAYTEVLEEQLEILAEPRDSHRLDDGGGSDRAGVVNPAGA